MLASEAAYYFGSSYSPPADEYIYNSPSNFLPENTKQELLQLCKKRSATVSFKNITVTKSSTDKGGHGGTLRLECSAEKGGKPLNLFLKPLNQVELDNYLYVQENRGNVEENSLVNHMIHAYGSIKINGVDYLVMDDVSAPSLHQTTLLDIKLAGKVPGINPICSLNEIKWTGRKKGFFDYIQMWLGAWMSPHFMIASGHKFLRLFNYRKSSMLFKKTLAQFSDDEIGLLNNKLQDIKTGLSNCKLAFIGASIIIIKDTQGHLIPKLADLAHIQAEPVSKDNTNNNSSSTDAKYFSGTKVEYDNRRRSNVLAIDEIIKVVAGVQKKS